MKVPWNDILRSGPVLSLVLTHFANNSVYYTLLSCLPLYFHFVLRFNIIIVCCCFYHTDCRRTQGSWGRFIPPINDKSISKQQIIAEYYTKTYKVIFMFPLFRLIKVFMFHTAKCAIFGPGRRVPKSYSSCCSSSCCCYKFSKGPKIPKAFLIHPSIYPSIHLFISGSLAHIRNTRNTEK